MKTKTFLFASLAAVLVTLLGTTPMDAAATHTEVVHNSLGAVNNESEFKQIIETDICAHSSSIVLQSTVTEDGSNDEHYINWDFDGCSTYDHIEVKSYVNGVLQNVDDDVNATGSITFDSDFVGGNIVRATLVVYW